MALTTWVIDKSAYVRLGLSPDFELWSERIERGLVRMSSISRLEIGYSFTSIKSAELEIHQGALGQIPIDAITPRVEERAQGIQFALLRAGTHRGVSVPDLLVAATAEIYGRTVLHVDRDFDLIAAVSGLNVERLVTA